MDYNILAGVLLLILIGGMVVIRLNKTVSQRKPKLENLAEQLSELIRTNPTSPAEMRDSIVQGDKLLGDALNVYNCCKETVGDALKSSRNLYNKSVYNEIWNAHKLRNQVVHEGYTPTKSEVKASLNSFRDSVKRLI